MANSEVVNSSSVPHSKAIRLAYYGTEPVDAVHNIWKCKGCDNIRKWDKRNGYSNLVSHVKEKHPDLRLMDTLITIPPPVGLKQSLDKQTTLHFFIDPKAHDIYKWIDWIVMDELELSFCEQEHSR